MSGLAHPLTTGHVEVSNLSHGHQPSPTPARWAWLTDTYWYVPKANLPATLYNSSTGTLAPVLDQTVYHILGYREGYFWGQLVTQLGVSGTPSSSAMVGTVTPQGHILLNLVSTAGTTQGIGTMTKSHGQWTMENQMFTGSSSGIQVGHWAYMVQSHKGQKSWNSLPMAGVSVPTFLKNYSGPTPTPIA